jgi:hypothetical protein
MAKSGIAHFSKNEQALFFPASFKAARNREPAPAHRNVFDVRPENFFSTVPSKFSMFSELKIFSMLIDLFVRDNSINF